MEITRMCPVFPYDRRCDRAIAVTSDLILKELGATGLDWQVYYLCCL